MLTMLKKVLLFSYYKLILCIMGLNLEKGHKRRHWYTHGVPNDSGTNTLQVELTQAARRG